jgi:hypothetical protein
MTLATGALVTMARGRDTCSRFKIKLSILHRSDTFASRIDVDFRGHRWKKPFCSRMRRSSDATKVALKSRCFTEEPRRC